MGKPSVEGPAGSGEALSPTLLAGRLSPAVAAQPVALCLLWGRGAHEGGCAMPSTSVPSACKPPLPL